MEEKSAEALRTNTVEVRREGRRTSPRSWVGSTATLLAMGLTLSLACEMDPGVISGTGGSSPAGGTSGGAAAGGSPAGGASTGGVSAGGLSSGGSTTGGSGGSPLGGTLVFAGGTAGESMGGAGEATFVLSSPAFENVDGCGLDDPRICDVFPDDNVSYMDRPNQSPELHWAGAPAGTQSFALVLFDVTFGQAHWALWNIPAETAMLPAHISDDSPHPPTPSGSTQANANFATTSESGYFGPHIPCNLFEFELYALSQSSFLPKDPESAVLISIELQDLGEPVLGIARLAARAGDYDAACE